MIVEKVDEIRPGKVKIMKRGSLQGKDRYKGGRGGGQGGDSGAGGGGLVLTCIGFHQTGRGGRRHHWCILMQLVMAVV